jgi:hypothetical protein
MLNNCKSTDVINKDHGIRLGIHKTYKKNTLRIRGVKSDFFVCL